MTNKNEHPDRKGIEEFLRNAQEQGDESLRLAAGELLRHMQHKFRNITGVTKKLSPEQEREQACLHAKDKLIVFLQSAKKQGRSAWEEVRRKVEQFINEFPEFKKDLLSNTAYTNMIYSPQDGSWFVFMTGEAGTVNYDIGLTSPEKTDEWEKMRKR